MGNLVRKFNEFSINESKSSLNKKELEDILDMYKNTNPEIENYIFNYSDARLGEKVALAKEGDSGSISPKTDYMTYSEMKYFLMGYNRKHLKL